MKSLISVIANFLLFLTACLYNQIASIPIASGNTEVELSADGYYKNILIPVKLDLTFTKSNMLSASSNSITNPQVFGAKADGVTDDTAAFQAAVNDSSIVEVPPGTYLLSGTVIMPKGVKIFGYSRHSTVVSSSGDTQIQGGSILHVTSTMKSPFIYTSGNCFEGLTFYYPNQSSKLTAPQVYPPTFSPGSPDVITNCAWNDLQFVNSYQWIDARKGHLDFEFKNIVGAPLHRGIDIDGNGGTDTFVNIRGSYYYFCQASDPAARYMQNNSVGISIGRSDAFHMQSIFFGSLNVGLLFYKGNVNDNAGPYGSVVGLSLDGNNYGILCKATHPIGVNISDLMANSRVVDIEFDAGTDPGRIQVSGAKLWGAPSSAIRLRRPATFKMQNAEIWGCSSSGLLVGAPNCDINFVGVVFDQMTAPPIVSNSTCRYLFLDSNNFNTPPLFSSTPSAMVYRYRGNTYLPDDSGGSGE